MPKILTEVSQFSADVTVPEGGDARTALSVEAPFQKLTDRSLFLHDVVKGNAPLGSLITRQKLIPLPDGFPNFDSGAPQWVLHTSQGYWTKLDATGGGGLLWFPLDVPRGATIDKIDAIVRNADGASNVDMILARIAGADFVTPAPPAIAVVGSVSTPSSVGNHLLTLDVNETDIDTSVTTWVLQIQGSSAATDDRVYAVRITFGDPGPRNF